MYSFEDAAAHKLSEYVKKRSVKAPLVGIVIDPPKRGHVEYDTAGEEFYHYPLFVYGFLGKDSKPENGRMDFGDVFPVGKKLTRVILGTKEDVSEYLCQNIERILKEKLLGDGPYKTEMIAKNALSVKRISESYGRV